MKALFSTGYYRGKLIDTEAHIMFWFSMSKLFENPIKKIPEYILISISMAKPYVGNILLDELLSILLPLFLGDH